MEVPNIAPRVNFCFQDAELWGRLKKSNFKAHEVVCLRHDSQFGHAYETLIFSQELITTLSCNMTTNFID
jgi:hypothetical protein